MDMRLYHFTSAEFAISNIALQRLKIARFGDLNDPFELLAAKLSDKEFRKAIKSWKQNFHDNIGLLCFSESWNNPVLWSHYGDKHKGICLGFDVEDQYAMAVNYSKERIKVRFKNNDSEQGLSREFVNEMLLTKYEHWMYEKERRMFKGLDEGTKENGLFFYEISNDIELKEVILGPNCEVPISRIEGLVSKINLSIRIIKARLAFQNFEVVIDRRYEN